AIDKWHLARNEDKVSGLHEGDIVGRRGRGIGKGDSHLVEALFDVAHVIHRCCVQGLLLIAVRGRCFGQLF
ncbi:MAG TPA: hypothetical protein DC036_04135, partial [Alphaproteobacteria bacterium]|nr:hypothetical protein [Alphaproteobacteria bacterium]